MADTSSNLENKVDSTSTMKAEAPAEAKVSAEVEEFKICSVSNSTSNNVQGKQPGGILKPPQLTVNTKPASFVLAPSRLNPFASQNATNDNKVSSSQTNGDTLKFVPLLHNSDSEAKSSKQVSSSSVTNFVFGQNLQERVVSASETKADEAKASTSLNSNGTTDMLFTNAVKNDVKSDVGTVTKSLSESAQEYEASRAVKRKYEEVEVLTGEEDETNILNITCKLFAFDKAVGSWQERGRGVLRLNDFQRDGGEHSRVLFRTMGSLRVVLNTPIWAEMSVQQASEKSVRFTAIDQQGLIKVFLVTASIEDSKQLFNQMQFRVRQEVSVQKLKKPNIEAIDV